MAIDRDNGLHIERTILAWRRTTVAVTLGLPLIARSFDQLGMLAVALLSAPAIAAVWLVHASTARRHRDFLASDRTSETSSSVGAMAAGMAGAAATVAVSALIAVLGGMPHWGGG